ncbi:serine hydrolase domain-containing protein [uncultured Erythrobacter sp.]|uniref:serine hydrolase domain-containing protein n=1 Tax=uncultured Erythrobacter sp. TaxID=263913 RepID=UPI0026080111|nr:serine hydrolase domain-containing protein [uncultured Erythrobacter sp.]
MSQQVESADIIPKSKKFSKAIARVAVVALLMMIAVLALAWTALYLYHVPVPDLDGAAPVDRGVASVDHAETITTAREMLLQARTELAAPSVSIAVARDGQLVWSEAVGYASLGDRKLATVKTAYPIGSVSKAITATLTMDIAEEGLIDIDKDVRDYVPTFPQKRYPVTLRQLLSHQGGIRHYGFAFAFPTFSEAGYNVEFSTSAQALAIFEDDPLLFEPDSDFSYSTFGYTLAGSALEGATNQSFLELLDQRVFEPLGMDDSGPERPDVFGERLASGYVSLLSRNQVMPAPKTNHSYKWAGGGLASTPSDLARFGSSLLSGQILEQATREEMFAIRKTSDGAFNEQHYALGWRNGGLENGENTYRMINHGGATAGATAILLIFPDQSIVVAMTANTVRAGGSNQIMKKAARIATVFLQASD